MAHFLSITLFPLMMIVAGAGDALSLRIPNWLSIAVAVTFFPMALATGMPLHTLAVHVAAGFGLFALGFSLFSLGLFGGGDAKLLAAAGLWLGWPDLVQFIVMTALAGGLLALAICAYSLAALSSELEKGSLFKRFFVLKPNVPYGYALAVGGILAFPGSWWMQVVA